MLSADCLFKNSEIYFIYFRNKIIVGVPENAAMGGFDTTADQVGALISSWANSARCSGLCRPIPA
jgi:hypothetical protein